MKHKHQHKKLVSITLFIVGILLLVFSINSMHKIAVRKSFTEIEVPANELQQTVRDQRRSAEYDTLVVISLIAGVVLTVSGASSLIFYRNKR